MPARPAISLSPVVEDYIKQIYKLTQHGERATTKALADRLGVGRGTVSGMLKHLAQRRLVEHQRYHGARLTAGGRKLAMQMIRRHRLIELFLVRFLGLGWDEVDHQAERLEHAVSDRLIERMDAVLDHPDVDPHGAPIPDAAGQVEQQDFAPLSKLAEGQSCTVRRVSDRDPAFLQYLRQLGVRLNGRLKIMSIEPFGTMQVRIGRRKVHLAHEAADRIHVTHNA